jgi:hypothetical protein
VGVPVTFAHATSVISAFPTAPAAIVGFGYVPVRSPLAGPLGGSVVGIVGAPVIFAYATSVTFAFVTAPLASSGVPTTPAARSGFG